MKNVTNHSELKAGTGFMLSLSQAISHFEKLGYTENLVASVNHFNCRGGAIEIQPQEVRIDEVVRFENTSDPDDQSILYAISSPQKNIKGLYVDSYGAYHEDLSPDMLRALRPKNEPRKKL